MLRPIAQALAQLDDRVFLGVLARSVLWAALAFALLIAGLIWGGQAMFAGDRWLGWGSAVLGTMAVLLASVWLFVPVAAAIGTIYVERIAQAVERRWYPGLPAASGASAWSQVVDGAAVGLRVLGLSLVALVLALLLPGLGLLLGWAVSAWALGRGLFGAVALRRHSAPVALALYRARRPQVIGVGAALVAAGFVPFVNLLVPVLGIAAMIHVLQAPRA